MAEIILNFIGLDDLADYSEFLSEHKLQVPQIVIAPKTLIKIQDSQLDVPIIINFI